MRSQYRLCGFGRRRGERRAFSYEDRVSCVQSIFPDGGSKRREWVGRNGKSGRERERDRARVCVWFAEIDTMTKQKTIL